MADENNQYLHEVLLKAVIQRSVSEKFGTLLRELGELTKDMTAADAKEAKVVILDMVWNSLGGFYAKMRSRIEKQEQQPE